LDCDRGRRQFLKKSLLGGFGLAILGTDVLVCGRVPELADVVYKKTSIPCPPNIAHLQAAAGDYRAIVLSPLQFIVDRYFQNPQYPWVDTKLSLITGENFAIDDPLRGLSTVYGWIQGRALEALTGHAAWLRQHYHDENAIQLLRQIDSIINTLYSNLQKVWQNNSRHLFFFLSQQGEPFLLDLNGQRNFFTLTRESATNYSDIFGAKGLYAAAHYLQDDTFKDQAKDYCLSCIEAIWQGRFQSDQQPLDPKNPVTPVPGRRSHGPYMITIGIAALLAQFERDSASVDIGLDLIHHIFDNHINRNNRWRELQEYDFVEFITESGQPYERGGKIISDPGHSLEFVGLALKFTSACKKFTALNPAQKKQIALIESEMSNILKQNFNNGFQTVAQGICKHFDLLTRQPVNSDMPWWSLPETMRAALYCSKIAATQQEREECLCILSQSHNAFVQNYIRPDLHLMAYQTRAGDGSVIDTIPATPDADPGYHTGLSLIGCLDQLETVL
jgi:mannose/cellobiose epimerase-like protein (N-acyl-D-glucosamine 2-epimerase family)